MNEFFTKSNVVGIDIGNITTVGYSFLNEVVIESRVAAARKIDDLGENQIFEFNGEKLVSNSGRFENNIIKFKKSNFLALLNFAIANSTDKNNVKVCIGIPAGQYSSLRDELKDFILSNNINQIRLGDSYDSLNQVRNIEIEDVLVIPEGYGIKTDPLLIERCKKNMNTYVLDIGGGTTDIAIFNPRFKFISGDSISLGLLDLYKETRKIINERFNVNISLEDSRKYLDGELQLLDDEFEKSYKESIILAGAEKIISDFSLQYPEALTSNIILAYK